MKRTWSQAKAQESRANEYGKLGIIESVKLLNFMCHDNLSFDFDPHMNFIIGRNGSGKSAILTGIILALGGKSSSTGRFGNIKGFIKTGKSSASVSVTLKNCGPDAYKPDDYGEKITVERHFTIEGVNSYKLKSENGRIISNLKEELINILNVMDIQVENPVTVLNQDTSKTFLVSKFAKSDKLFKIFYEGTGLSKVYDDYNQALQQSNDAKSELANKKAILYDMEKDVKAIKVLLDRSTKINELEKELLWATVIKFEKERDEELKAFENVQNNVSELNEKLCKQKAELAKISENLVLADSTMKASQVVMKDIRANIIELESSQSGLTSEIQKISGTCSRLQREVNRIESDISSLEKVMDTIRMQNQQDLEEEKLKHEQTIANLNEQIFDADAAIDILKEKESSSSRKAKDIEGKIDVCQAEIQDLKSEKDRIERERQQTLNGMKSRINVFGQKMVDVLQEIKRTNIFKKKPIGPLGLYIDVKKPEWSFAIQECLKMRLLKSFVCDNYEDGEKLSKIFSKCFFQNELPTVIVSPFASQVYDVSAHKCVSTYPTVLDMLIITNPVVTNCLIDQASIENILLIEDPVNARNLMLHKPPNKCAYVYCLNGDQFYHTPIRKYSCRAQKRFCILKGFHEEDIKAAEIECQRINEMLKIKENRKKELFNELKMVEKEIKEIGHAIMEKRVEKNQLRRKLKDEEMSYDEPKDINNLIADMEKYRKDKADCEIPLNSNKELLTAKTFNLNDIKEKLESFLKALQTETDNYSQLHNEVNDLQNKKDDLLSVGKRIKHQLEQLEEELKDKEKCVAEKSQIVKVAINSAIAACPRVDTERSLGTLRNLLNEMKNALKKQRNTDRESLLKEYKEKVTYYKESKSKLVKQENVNDRLSAMILGRFLEFKRIANIISTAMTCIFASYLKENNFSGHTEIDFESKTLAIYAKPCSSKKKFGEMAQLCQLSGGEKSFVTIAFLLALWDRLHAPFRILDEYDVFMDSNNRQFSIQLLINKANSNKNVQYIFLSPLELPHMENSEHVKVHKMSDPKR